MTKSWNETDTLESFQVKIAQSDYIIAKGDRRSFVVIDQDQQTHSLSRNLKGITAKQVKERLGDLSHYPTITEAKAQAKTLKYKQVDTKRSDLSREQKLMVKLRRQAIRADQLNEQRSKALIQLKTQLKKGH